MKLKTELHQTVFNRIASFQGIKPNGPGSFYLAAWIMSYNERQIKEIPLPQIGHAAGWNARKLISYMEEFPTESKTALAVEYTPVEISDIKEFLASYERAFGRPISPANPADPYSRIIMKSSHLYTPDAWNAINGVYPISQTPSVFTVEDVTGRRLYATDHDAFALDHILGRNNPLNGPTVLTPRELDDVHSLIVREVIIPDYSETSE